MENTYLLRPIGPGGAEAIDNIQPTLLFSILSRGQGVAYLGGTRVGFGWVCAAQASKWGPCFRKDLQPK